MDGISLQCLLLSLYLLGSCIITSPNGLRRNYNLLVRMNELAKNLWAFFFASLLFGVWLIPILIGVFAIYVVIYIKWPEFFKKYL